ncbi:trypsin-like peptidase domain-containing protein [Flavobacterium sp.]|uniref:trypsin-like serine peptidase n=1 Tax=Flavobacterium sp. TaxID=239 RepID=UPI0026387590|nr:trypsin-like peptidase domain-containing protein [Flavobacterium sp.]
MTTKKTDAPMSPDEVKKVKDIKAKKAVSIDNEGSDQVEAIGVKVLEKGARAAMEIPPYCPDQLDQVFNLKADKEGSKKPKFIDRETFMQPEGSRTIFGPDQRTVYNSTAYPWGCVGRVETALGYASGVMIGPRHVLTCCHVIDFKADGSTGWLKFSPMYYNGPNATFGTANAIKIYYKYKVQGPTIDSTEGQYDYSVIVLDRNIGNTTGWMGAKAYSDSWDGQVLWTHAGYPMDLTGAQRPVYQNSISFDGDNVTTDAHEAIYHQADIWPGQSGGPFWGYWGGTPYAVAVQSWQNASTNAASGGSNLLDLVNKARTEFP